jgi:hypothetical protein
MIGCALRTIETQRQNMSSKLGLRGRHSFLKLTSDRKLRL